MKIFLGLLFFIFSGITMAAVDEQHGKEKAVVCVACHGNNGMSTNPIWPNLAGQHPTYLIKQLRDLKVGKLRHSPIMAPFVAGLNEDDIASLALFYSKQSLIIQENKDLNQRGEELYRVGDLKKQITACIACHGPTANGNDLAGFPALKGQQIEYTIQQLQAFKLKQRKNDLSGIMQTISARMSDQDMQAVATYLAHSK